MSARKTGTLSFVILTLLSVSKTINLPNDAKLNDENGEVFVASEEWRPVAKGQRIPPGLHVRMNLQTGETEAKLMNEDSRSASDLIPTERNFDGNEDEASVTKNFQESIGAVNDFSTADTDGAAALESNKKFRDIETLKDELKDLFDVEMKTDGEIMKSLMSKYNSSSSLDEKLDILYNLEYHLHRYDNAIDFAAMDGFRLLIFDMSNASSPKLKSGVAHCLGSAISSNPKMQIEAMKLGLLDALLSGLATSRPAATVANDSDDLVHLSRTIYAISALTRNFPFAQRRFLLQGGANLSMAAMDFAFTRNADGRFLKLALKIAGFIADLAGEKRRLSRPSSEVDFSSEEDATKLEQYDRVDVLDDVKDFGWCEKLARLSSFVSNSNSLDLIDKLVVVLEEAECEVGADAAVWVAEMEKTLTPLSEEEEVDEGENGDKTVRNLRDRLKMVLNVTSASKTEL